MTVDHFITIRTPQPAPADTTYDVSRHREAR